jgi:hypothetical protein
MWKQARGDSDLYKWGWSSLWEGSKEALTGKLSKSYTCKHFIFKVSDTGSFEPLVFNSEIFLKISIVSNFAGNIQKFNYKKLYFQQDCLNYYIKQNYIIQFHFLTWLDYIKIYLGQNNFILQPFKKNAKMLNKLKYSLSKIHFTLAKFETIDIYILILYSIKWNWTWQRWCLARGDSDLYKWGWSSLWENVVKRH